jgi:hypothetical protein
MGKGREEGAARGQKTFRVTQKGTADFEPVGEVEEGPVKVLGIEQWEFR